jgi:hypothetical protein
MFTIFALICIGVSINAVENIPDVENNSGISEDIIDVEENEIPQEPSKIAEWIEENIIQVVIGIGTGVITFIIALWRIIIFIKKVLDKIKKERETTNELHNHSTTSLNEFRDELKQSLTDLIRSMNLTNEQSKDALDKVNEFVSSVDNRFENITILQNSIVDTIKLLATNLPELVRNGTAERIMKIFESDKVISNDKNQSELKSEKA